MQILVSVENAPNSAAETGPSPSAGCFMDPKASIIFDPPVRVRSVEMNRTHAKSASRCPAVINMESRYFEIKCPFDLHLQFARDKDGKPILQNMLGERARSARRSCASMCI